MSGLDFSRAFELVSSLELGEVAQLSLAAGQEVSAGHVPPFPVDAPALVMDVQDVKPARAALLHQYPAEHPVRLLEAGGQWRDIQLGEWNQAGSLYLPPLPVGSSFEAFHEIISHLRAPDGCPWDREQTHLTLRKHLLEETYETLTAMDAGDAEKMREEFGDLLLQIVLNAQIACEYGEFTLSDILKGIYDKIIRRHPHVFGEVQVDGVGQVLSNWESIKKEERNKKGEGEKSLLDGLPAALPALNQAQEYQDRAARVGFDWPEIDGVLEKVKEEIEEVRQANNPAELSAELGDLFFVLVNLARWKKVDAEAALREASLKFKKRFSYIEKRASEMKHPMKAMSLQELDNLWNEAKQKLSGE
jgi:tetrapyrrole methylase family protein / MazG family protein